MNTKNTSKRTPKGTARKNARKGTTQQTRPEPTNKQSAAWRRWKVAEIRAVFEQRSDAAATQRCWNEFKDLLANVIDHPSFYHVENALLLLPALLSIKQTLDEQDAQNPDD